ncbi:AAA family ATPase [Herbaspirillum sp. alder98]|uniref:AAA family ATPase n=1 Tax=Herbaspirillum sp. alder98 TaxID=2913096 RepID=UPI001CD83620|nr:AAA family ATPase [Herbaspirillum sp. alder98]MCA1325144.1 AAA family ATPase [Herbaspirillum sp. alder98]
MKLERLGKIHKHRIFKNFSWANSLADFARFNLIYGWNGTGKTTLSGLFNALQLRSTVHEGDVEFVFNGQTVLGENLTTAPIPQVRVFNRDTVARSIFELAGDPSSKLPPVYVFGEESAEKQRQLDLVKQALPALQEQTKSSIREEARAKKELEDFAVKTARAIKNLLIASGGEFNNYNAADFKTEITAFSKSPLPPLEEDERKNLLVMKDGKPMELVELPSFFVPNIATAHSQVKEALHKTVLSTVIDELVSNPDLSFWVETGLSLHAHDPERRCKFCTQPISSQRIQDLQKHFNDEFKQFSQALEVMSVRLENLAGEVSATDFPDSAYLYPEIRTEYERAISDFGLHRTNLKNAILALSTAVSRKKERIFERLELSDILLGGDGVPNNLQSGWRLLSEAFVGGAALLSEFMGKAAFERAKNAIERHNEKTTSFSQQVNSARIRLHQHELTAALPGWIEKQGQVDSLSEAKESAQKSLQDLEKQKMDLEAVIQDHRQPADELNNELFAYLGHREVRVEIEETGYRLIRHDGAATNLSEGECTAIAFLYFLKSLQDRSFDLKNGIVVIDDPISSLDTNAIYNAFGFMKRRLANVGQLFVLTHNFTFLRQTRNWFSHMNKSRQTKGSAQFFMLKAAYENGHRCSTIEPMDAFIKDYESEYHYLFKRVMTANLIPENAPLHDYYELPNLVRRLLESFLVFKVPDESSLHTRLEAVSYDDAKKTRIIRFLDTHSHAEQIAEGHDDSSALSEAPYVIKDVLALMEAVDEGHFLRMKQTIPP